MHLSVGQLARLAGYRNLSKGSKRIHAFESSGFVRADLLDKLGDVLHVDAETVGALVRTDRRRFLREWAKWASVSIRPYIVIRLLPGWYTVVNVPEDRGDFASAKAFAAAKAREARRDVCLVWSRRVSVYFGPTGAVTRESEAVPGGEHTPWMRVAGKTFLPGVGLIDWPRMPQALNERD